MPSGMESMSSSSSSTCKRHRESPEIESSSLPPKRPRESKELIDLNDFCLIRIFRELSLNDLNAVNGTCKRFYQIAGAHVYRHHVNIRNLDISKMRNHYMRKDNKFNLFYSAECIQGYLKRFGHIIEHIEFLNMYSINHQIKLFMKDIYNSIVTNCSISLKSMNLHRIELTSKTFSNGESLFDNLNKLEVSANLNCGKMMSMSQNLQDLSLYFDTNSVPNYECSFPKLKTFKFEYLSSGNGVGLRPEYNGRYRDNDHHDDNDKDDCGDEDENNVKHKSLGTWLNAFIEKHLKLTSMNLILAPNFDISIIDKLTELEELYLDCKYVPFFTSSEDKQSLNSLSKLTKMTIKINFQRHQDHSVLSNFLLESASAETLLRLELLECTVDKHFVNGLSRFHNLRYLSLSRIIYNHESTPHWERLQRLNSLTLLNLNGIHFAGAKLFLQNLGNSQRSLHTFLLSCTDDESINEEFVANLTSFEYLKHLRLHMNLNDDENLINWHQFKRLTQLKQLFIHNRARIPTESALQYLFNNLVTEINLEIDFNHYSDHLCNMKLIPVNCDKIKEIHLIGSRFWWSDVILLIGKLNTIKLIKFDMQNNLSLMDDKIYKSLIEACRLHRENRKLIINVPNILRITGLSRPSFNFHSSHILKIIDRK